MWLAKAATIFIELGRYVITHVTDIITSFSVIYDL